MVEYPSSDAKFAMLKERHKQYHLEFLDAASTCEFRFAAMIGAVVRKSVYQCSHSDFDVSDSPSFFCMADNCPKLK